jgi:uncharacterized protein YjiK
MSCFFVLGLLSATLSGCAGAHPDAEFYSASQAQDSLVWRNAVPDTIFTLKASLKEISGLAFHPSGVLLAVQDEDGDIFALSPDDGAVLEKTRFASDGDFEGIAATDESVLVLRSDATLYLMPSDAAVDGGDQRGPSRKFSIDMHSSCDAESLAHLPGSTNYWVVCKENPGKGLGQVRAVYEFTDEDDGSKKGPKPRLAFTLTRPPDPKGRPLRRSFFKPAGLAMAPDSTVLVISSVKPALYRYTLAGVLLEAWRLPTDTLPQPEGVAVAPDGTLYIASEAKGRSRSSIAVFSTLLK